MKRVRKNGKTKNKGWKWYTEGAGLKFCKPQYLYISE